MTLGKCCVESCGKGAAFRVEHYERLAGMDAELQVCRYHLQKIVDHGVGKRLGRVE